VILVGLGLGASPPAVLAAVDTPAPAPRPSLAPLTFYPDWFPSAQFAGIYVAVDRGFYREAGLDFSVQPFALGRKMGEGMDADPDRATVGTMEGYIFLQARARGADLVAYTAVLRESPAGFLSLRDRAISSARDFAGRRIGVHKYADPLYRWFLQRAGVPESAATMVFVGDDLDLLIGRKVDAMQGYAVDEGVRLQRRVGAAARFLSFRDLGFDSYSQVIYATAAETRRHARLIGVFIEATRRGWRYALAHPAAAVDSVMTRLKPGADRLLQRSMLEALRPYVAPAGAVPLGPMDVDKWMRMQLACVEMGLLPRAEQPVDFLFDPGK
jgi:ABC-type nitrate/sulfonate/bicarbonate transport system substrate-binding protein